MKFSTDELLSVVKTNHWLLLYPLFIVIAAIAYLAINLSITPRIGDGVWHGIAVKSSPVKPELMQVCQDYTDVKIEGNKISTSIVNYANFKSCMMSVLASDSDLQLEKVCLNDEQCKNNAEAFFTKNAMSAEKTIVHEER